MTKDLLKHTALAMTICRFYLIYLVKIKNTCRFLFSKFIGPPFLIVTRFLQYWYHELKSKKNAKKKMQFAHSSLKGDTINRIKIKSK